MTVDEFQKLCEQYKRMSKATPKEKLAALSSGLVVFVGYNGSKAILEHGFIYVVADGPITMPSTVLYALAKAGWSWEPTYQAWKLEA